MCRFKCDVFGDQFQDGFDGVLQAVNYSTLLERRISYGNVAKVLAVEGFHVPQQTVWATIQKYKTHGTISR